MVVLFYPQIGEVVIHFEDDVAVLPLRICGEDISKMETLDEVLDMLQAKVCFLREVLRVRRKELQEERR
jgi:hypothetical protein